MKTWKTKVLLFVIINIEKTDFESIKSDKCIAFLKFKIVKVELIVL